MAKDKSESAQERQLRENPINVFTCDTCKGLESMEFTAFKEHLKNEHSINTEKLKGTKQMVMHMDGDFWYSYNYKWTLENGHTFHQYIEQVRDKDDMMRF